MSTTYGLDLSEFDRRRRWRWRWLDRDRHSAEFSIETTAAGRAVGSPVQLNQKLVGCGCFGCSSLVFLAGCVVLLVLVWGFLIPDWRSNNRYIASSGVVLDTRVHSQLFDVAGPKGQGVRQVEYYRPEIKIQYEVNGRKFESWSYDATGNHSPDRAAQQAIADSFQVGATYPCWYDPDRPERAILVRGHTWGAYVFLIVPLGLLTIGVAGMWIARTIAASQPATVASGGYPTQAPTVPSFLQRLQGLVTPLGAFDPSRIGDPLAMKTEWSPMKGGGGNFRTHKLVEVDPDRLAFRATAGGFLLASGFLLFGVVVSAVVLKGIGSGLVKGTINFNNFITLPVALLFSAIGGYLLYSWTTPMVFDRRMGLFWRGWKEPEERFDGSLSDNAASLRAIHALQLIPTFASQYGSYEINLVMADGERLHVVVYASGSRNRLREDAAILARFLGKPVWDAV